MDEEELEMAPVDEGSTRTRSRNRRKQTHNRKQKRDRMKKGRKEYRQRLAQQEANLQTENVVEGNENDVNFEAGPAAEHQPGNDDEDASWKKILDVRATECCRNFSVPAPRFPLENGKWNAYSNAPTWKDSLAVRGDRPQKRKVPEETNSMGLRPGKKLRFSPSGDGAPVEVDVSPTFATTTTSANAVTGTMSASRYDRDDDENNEDAWTKSQKKLKLQEQEASEDEQDFGDSDANLEQKLKQWEAKIARLDVLTLEDARVGDTISFRRPEFTESNGIAISAPRFARVDAIDLHQGEIYLTVIPNKNLGLDPKKKAARTQYKDLEKIPTRFEELMEPKMVLKSTVAMRGGAGGGEQENVNDDRGGLSSINLPSILSHLDVRENEGPTTEVTIETTHSIRPGRRSFGIPLSQDSMFTPEDAPLISSPEDSSRSLRQSGDLADDSFDTGTFGVAKYLRLMRGR